MKIMECLEEKILEATISLKRSGQHNFVCNVTNVLKYIVVRAKTKRSKKGKILKKRMATQLCKNYTCTQRKEK